MRKYRRRKRRLAGIVISIILLLIAGVFTFMMLPRDGQPTLLDTIEIGRKTASTEHGWNLILVNEDYYIPDNYEVELTELSNGKKVDSRIYPSLQSMFDDARANGLALFVREGYRTSEEQQQIMDERVAEYQGEGYSKSEAKKLARDYVAELFPRYQRKLRNSYFASDS